MVKVTRKASSTDVTVPETIPFIIELTMPQFTDLKKKKKVIDSDKLARWKAEWYLQVNSSREIEVDGAKVNAVSVFLNMKYLYPEEMCIGYQVNCTVR